VAVRPHSLGMVFHVIDDQPFICFFISEVLCNLGHEVETFTSSERYMEYLESPGYLVPTAVFTDITMPFISGYELMEAVHRQFPETHVVLMSGVGEINSRYKGCGCTFLRKPFDMDVFESVVDSMPSPQHYRQV